MSINLGAILAGVDQAFTGIDPTDAASVNTTVAQVAGTVSATAAQVGHIASGSTFTATVAQAFGVSEGELVLGAGAAILVIILLVRRGR